MDSEVNVFALVLFGHWYVGATRLEVDGEDFAEPVFGDGKGLLQDAGDVVLPEFGTVSTEKWSKLEETRTTSKSSPCGVPRRHPRDRRW